MNIFDMGKSLRTGVFDMLNSTSGYYGDLMPEANTMKLKRIPYAKFRENGGYEFFDGLIQEVNAKWVARGKGDVPFNLYLSERAPVVDKPDLHGLKLRVSPNYRAFFTALGATLVQTSAVGNLHLDGTQRGRRLRLADPGHRRTRPTAGYQASR